MPYSNIIVRFQAAQINPTRRKQEEKCYKQQTTDNRLTLTPEEAFKIIGCGRTLGYELIRTNRLSHVRLGPKKIVIPRKAIEELLASAEGGDEEGSEK